MPDRLPTPSSSPQQDPSTDGHRQSASPDPESTGSRRSGRPDTSDNPFAAPPEGSPDRPWQPRQPKNDDERDGQNGGSRWSSRQPGRSANPFGQRPGDGDEKNPGQGGGPGGLRWDPTDPVQRRARYALLAGMWAFFFALFSWPYVGLLLGALALYWGISSLRSDSGAGAGGQDKDGGKDKSTRASAADIGAGTPDHSRPQVPGQPAGGQPARPQKTAAISGIVVGSLALAMVAATFTAQAVYRDYFTCVNDALTTTAQKHCGDLLPEQIRPLLETETPE
ncbi:hypothetical protein [Streptomyces boluensis]|uniref:Integral membrane protein n=1 Tax=Streptomyces boluensis TaxID=1775135 RepID=A0A964V1M6_9ACTN|nr:hypothetical protein [Streptomyces boluensis]NBE55440.1 hypothetical protein [Streptomyces boluensis]